MIIHEKPIEFYCMMGIRPGQRTGLGQILSPEHGRFLIRILQRYTSESSSPSNFMFAIPKVLPSLPAFAGGEIDKFLASYEIELEAYERDMITDDLAARAGLYPLIFTIRNYPDQVVVIGNEHLEETAYEILRASLFIPISSPNLHMEEGGIENCIERCRKAGLQGIYLVSAGVSSPVIIDILYSTMNRANQRNTFIDTGSIWDCFAGVGCQREWRRKLYSNPYRLQQWWNANLKGEPYA